MTASIMGQCRFYDNHIKSQNFSVKIDFLSFQNNFFYAQFYIELMEFYISTSKLSDMQREAR